MQRGSPVYEQLSCFGKCHYNTVKCALLQFRMPSVQRPDAHGEGDVVGLFAGQEDKVLHRHPAVLQMAVRNFSGGAFNGLPDCLLGAVDGQNKTRTYAAGYFPRGRTRATAYLQYTYARVQGDCVHNGCQPGR